MSINVKFPFKDSVKGFFLDMSDDNDSAIKNDLIHLLLTQKGERYYLPSFGSNLRKYIFEPMDGITIEDVRQEVNDTLKEYIPNLNIKKIHVDMSETSEFTATVRLDYIFVDGVFETKDFVVLKF